MSQEQTPSSGDMAYYCFAVAVVKADVTEVAMQISGSKPIIVSVRKETK